MRKITSSEASKSGKGIVHSRSCEYYSIVSERCALIEGARCVHNGDVDVCGFYELRQRKLKGKEHETHWQ